MVMMNLDELGPDLTGNSSKLPANCLGVSEHHTEAICRPCRDVLCTWPPLSLPPWSRVARRCPPSFRPFGGAEAEAPLG
jgi:hypothetical protein